MKRKTLKLTDKEAFWLWRQIYYGMDGSFEGRGYASDRKFRDNIEKKLKDLI